MVVMARLPGGGVGLINFSSGTPTTRQRTQVSVTLTRGTISFEPYGAELQRTTPDGESTEDLDEGRPAALRAMVRELRDSIAEDREPAMSGHEGIKDLAVVLAAYESVSSGREVRPEAP